MQILRCFTFILRPSATESLKIRLLVSPCLPTTELIFHEILYALSVLKPSDTFEIWVRVEQQLLATYIKIYTSSAGRNDEERKHHVGNPQPTSITTVALIIAVTGPGV
jgi:hypothetical protein